MLNGQDLGPSTPKHSSPATRPNVWCWPGNKADSTLIRQVKDDMRDWCLSKVIWVADRGFTSAEHRRYLWQGGGS
jgi:hypothetical protein